MSWIKKFDNPAEGDHLVNELVNELIAIEHDKQFNPLRIHWLRAFRSNDGIYVDAKGTTEQISTLQKLGYQWSNSEHSASGMQLIFEHNEDN